MQCCMALCEKYTNKNIQVSAPQTSSQGELQSTKLGLLVAALATFRPKSSYMPRDSLYFGCLFFLGSPGSLSAQAQCNIWCPKHAGTSWWQFNFQVTCLGACKNLRSKPQVRHSLYSDKTSTNNMCIFIYIYIYIYIFIYIYTKEYSKHYTKYIQVISEINKIYEIMQNTKRQPARAGLCAALGLGRAVCRLVFCTYINLVTNVLKWPKLLKSAL